ncbi:MAG: tetratricopeptide repeat protein [bacterium]|nr:tetratricopeptide repeat protein [bacterium]
MTEPSRWWLSAQPLPAALLLLAVIAAYSNSLDGPFLYDDTPAIVENSDIRQILPLWRAPDETDRASINSRPVVRLSLALNYAVGGLDVRGYHLVNVTLHLACGLLLFVLLRRTFVSTGSASGLALASALVWLVHPLNSQVVNYITQRSESLMALFFLGVIYAVERSRDGSVRWQVVAVVSALLGMASKEVMVVVPPLALLYDRTFMAGSFAQAWHRRRRLHTALAACWLLLAALLWSRPHGTSIGLVGDVGVGAYAMNQVVAIATYLKLWVWPDPLVTDYGYASPIVVTGIVAQLLAILIIVGGTIYALIRHPPLGFAGAWFLMILAPTSSFVPIVGEVAAERRVYLSSAALAVLTIVAVWLVLRRLRHPRLAPAVVTLVVVVLTLVTWTRNQDYRSSEAMWRTVVDARPGNARARSSLGVALADDGRLAEAMVYYRQALAMAPEYPAAHYNMANALLRTGQPQQAVAHYRMALAEEPEEARTHANLGAALQELGDMAGAERHNREAIRLRPRFAVAHNNLAIVLRARGAVVEAIEVWRRALEIDPDYALGHYNLAVALEAQGDADEAREHYGQALRLRPDLREAERRLRALGDGQILP